MHDLLRDAQAALLKNPVYEKGKDPRFANISYCRYCDYSAGHGHGETCVILRLEEAIGNE